MTRILRVQLVMAASIALLGACNSGTDSEPPGPAAKLVAVSDTVGTTAAGAELADSLVVRVLDANNRAVAGATVDWYTTGTSGTVSPSRALTDEKGRARAFWRPNTRQGTQRVIAQALTVDGMRMVEFRYNVVAGPTAIIRVTPEGAFLAAGETRQLAAVRLDAFGNLVTGGTIAWTSSNPAVATVNSNTGLVTGVAPGTADVTATSEGKSVTVRIFVGSGTASEDPFNSPTLALYTIHSEVPAQWTIGGGVVTASGGGKQSHLVRNDVVFRDGWVEAEMDRADEGGLVIRFVDPNNLYLLAIRDDGSLLGFRNVEIFKRVGGQFQVLTFGVNVNWPRGTVKRVRFEAVGSSLRGYVDGVLVIQATDISIQGSGGIGMRYHDVPEDPQTDFARYLTLRWSGS
ncbi:MAG TPA: Ig-like domain-containing protein [Longimicrobium sp.]|jgi:hypothetical protein